MAETAQKQRAQPAAAISAADAKRAKKDNYIPLKVRFQAWWEGIDAETLLRRRNKANKKPVAEGAKVNEPAGPSSENMTDFELLMSIQERVWGKDFIVPGGPEHAVDFIATAKLRPGSVLLDLSAGLGGNNRAISVKFDAMVEGLETDEAIAKMGASRAKHLALDGQAPVAHFMSHNTFLRVGRYECVYAHEAFYRVLDKESLFAEVFKSLKEEGHFVFSDLVYKDAESSKNPGILAWSENERGPTDPWTAEKYKEKLVELGFKIIHCDDETAKYHETIRDGWSSFSETLDDQTIDRRFVDVMMLEAKKWQCRTAAIKSGHMRFLRIHAIRPKPNIR